MDLERVVYKLEADVSSLKASVQGVQRDIQQTGRQFESFGASVRSSTERATAGFGALKLAIAAIGIGALTRDIFEAGIAFQRINNSLTFVTGSTTAAKREFDFLRETTNKFGLDLESSAAAYAKFAAAARGTALAGQPVRDLFVGLSQAVATMGLSAEQAEGALTALEQMISKGKVSAEELRGQLGERIPGAFQLFARAAGVSTQQLDKMLEQGQVYAADILPKVAAELQKTYGESAVRNANSAQAALNRFNSELFILKNEFAESGFLDGLTQGLGGLAETLKDPALRASLSAFGEFVGTSVKYLVEHVREVSAVAAALAGMAVPGPLPLKLGAAALAGGATYFGQGSPGTGDPLADLKAKRDALLKTQSMFVQRGDSPDSAAFKALRTELEGVNAAIEEEIENLKSARTETGDLTATTYRMADASKSAGTATATLTNEQKKAAREAAQLKQRRVDALKDLIAEGNAMADLRDALLTGSDAAIREARAANDLNEVLRNLEIDPASELAETFRRAHAATEDLTKQVNDLDDALQVQKQHALELRDALGEMHDEGRRERARPDDVAAAKATAESIKRSSQEAFNFQEEIAKETLEDIRGFLVNMFDDALATASVSFEDFWNNVGAMGQRILSNVMANYVVDIGRQLMNSTSTLASQIPSLAGSALGNLNIGGLATAGILGAGGGQFAATLTGGNALGGQIGGALGGIGGYALGNMVLPGIGGIIGGGLGSLLGGGLGGLFGGGSRRDNNFSGTFNPLTGEFNEGTNTNPDPKNQQLVASIAQELSTLVTGLKAFGGELDAATIRIKAGGESGFLVGTQNFDTFKEAQEAALKAVLGQFSGFDPKQQRALANSTATTAQGILADIAVPGQIDAFVRPGSQFRNAFDQINATFKQLLEANDRLDLGQEGGLRRGRQRQLNDLRAGVRAQFGIGTGDQFDVAANNIRESFAQLKRDADILKVSLEDLSAAEQKQLDAVEKQRVLANLQTRFEQRNALVSAGVVDLTPEQQALEQVHQQFLVLRARAEELGVSLRTLNRAEKERKDEIRAQYDLIDLQQEFANRNTLIDAGVIEMTPEERAIEGIKQQFAILRLRAEELGTSLSALNKAEKDRIEAVHQAAIDQARAAVDAARGTAQGSIDQALGGFQGLISPLQQFSTQLAGTAPGTAATQVDAIRGLFRSAVKEAGTGGIATSEEVANVTALGQQLIEASRNANASGAAFVSDFQAVQAAVADLTKSLQTDQESFLRSLPNEFKVLGDRISNPLEQLIVLIKEQIAAYRDAERAARNLERRQAARAVA